MAIGIGSGAILGGIGDASRLRRPNYGSGGVSLRTQGLGRRDRGGRKRERQEEIEELDLKAKRLDVESGGIELESKKTTRKLEQIKLRAAEREEQMAEALYDDTLAANQAELDSKLSELQRQSVIDFYDMARLTKQPDGTTLAGELVDKHMRWLGGRTEDTVARFYEDEESGEERLGLFRPSTGIGVVEMPSGGRKLTSSDQGWEPVLDRNRQPIDFSVEALQALRAESLSKGKKGKKPADVATAEWLMEENPNLTRRQAFDLIKTATRDPDKLFSDLLEIHSKTDAGYGKPLREQIDAVMPVYERLVERLGARTGVSGIDDDGSGGKVPQGAVDLLKQRPELADAFDKKYGKGAAKRILGER